MAGFPPMGSANPQNLDALAAAGDPRAIAAVAERDRMAAQQIPPAGGGGGMPMSQSQFSGYGKPVDPAAEARRNAVYQELIRRQQGR